MRKRASTTKTQEKHQKTSDQGSKNLSWVGVGTKFNFGLRQPILCIRDTVNSLPLLPSLRMTLTNCQEIPKPHAGVNHYLQDPTSWKTTSSFDKKNADYVLCLNGDTLNIYDRKNKLGWKVSWPTAGYKRYG